MNENITKEWGDFSKGLPTRVADVYENAKKHCEKITTDCHRVLNEYVTDNSIAPDTVCFVAIGSVGRMEALDASDLDLLPVLIDDAAFKDFQRHDQPIRVMLKRELGLHVSEGIQLTACAQLDDLTDQESVGGDKDSSPALTRRVLLLTEGFQVAGGYCLRTIRKNILHAYNYDATGGHHILAFCNDLARYYRTLCIEYKAKVDAHGKDWCTRNLKLRHSRKFWYFSTMLSIISLAERYSDSEYADKLVDELDYPPVLRLSRAAKSFHPLSLTDMYERYAFFLEFMSQTAHRDALSGILHTARHTVSIDNPFPCLKLNSDLMQGEIIRVIGQLPQHVRDRIYKWFLL